MLTGIDEGKTEDPIMIRNEDFTKETIATALRNMCLRVLCEKSMLRPVKRPFI